MQDKLEAQVEAEEEEAASLDVDPEAQARHQEQLRKAQMEEERFVHFSFTCTVFLCSADGEEEAA